MTAKTAYARSVRSRTTKDPTRRAGADYMPPRGHENAKDGVCEARRRGPKVRSPLTAVRAKCYDCCAGHMREIELCPVVDCPLYAYRFGKRPATASKRGKAVGTL